MQIDVLVPASSHTFVLKVDSYSDGELKGTLLHARLKRAVQFGSFMSLAIIIEDLMDLDSCPGATEHVALSASTAAVPFATFAIEILYRQNHCWQGRLIWEGENREENFRSALELMFLIDSVLAE